MIFSIQIQTSIYLSLQSLKLPCQNKTSQARHICSFIFLCQTREFIDKEKRSLERVDHSNRPQQHKVYQLLLLLLLLLLTPTDNMKLTGTKHGIAQSPSVLKEAGSKLTCLQAHNLLNKLKFSRSVLLQPNTYSTFNCKSSATSQSHSLLSTFLFRSPCLNLSRISSACLDIIGLADCRPSCAQSFHVLNNSLADCSGSVAPAVLNCLLL